MSDPTTPETRTIRVEVAVDTDNLRKWADWHASHRHPDVAHALYRSAERYDDHASALERVRALADEWDTLPCVCGYRIPNGNDDSSQCLSCAAEDLRTSLDGDS